ncbi:hypothetical protein KPH14_009694 [Odynerus spinipes]|uniref:Uncharacterized protein n=1 Tax=Odynerus spinipes TaxID=1348599 RepID=A0AAD9RR10_9HYME|nr:hypothetical protein KPH14_009694 [Odynerus spinipes]
MVRGGRLHGIFLELPPRNEVAPLAEAMCNFLCSKCKDLPDAGPLEPIVSRQTPDGCAHISLRKIENKGILCYLAVSPDGLTMPDEIQEELNANVESKAV